MRELKFRAWSKKCEEYIEDVIHDGSAWLEAEGYDYTAVSEIFDGDEFIVEQYTGLKDKNGKEIYEGDIVMLKPDEMYAKSYYGTESRMLITGAHRVYFEYGVFLAAETDEEHMPLGQYLPKELEVIGNIHENPELLEEEECANRL